MTTIFATSRTSAVDRELPSDTGLIEVTSDTSPVRLFATPESLSSAATERRGDRVAAMIGSAVHRASADVLLNEVFAAAAATTPTSLLTDGDLAAIVVNETTGATWLVTGTGQHRIFVHTEGEAFSAGTRLVDVARSVGETLTVDRGYEDMLLGFGFYPFGATPYAGISTTHAGSIHSPFETSGATVAAAPYEFDPGTDDPADALLAMLTDAVARQAGDEEDQAVLMGGFDSALVAALLRKRGHNVSTFTFDFGDARFNQANVDLVTKTLGTNHTWVPITADKLGAGLENLPQLLNQPSAQPHYQLHTVIAAEAVAEAGFSHVFTGDGCDAVFLGFPTVSKRAKIQSMLRGVPNGLLNAAITALSPGFVDQLGGHATRTARSTLRSQTLPWPASAHLATQYLDDVALNRIRLGAAPVQHRSLRDIRMELAKGFEDADALRVAFAGNGATGASRIKVDGAVLRTGVAQSSPFVDSLVKNFASALPIEVLRPQGSGAGDLGKALLSEMVLRHDLLPAVVVNQPKQSPATSPVDQWYSGPLRPVIEDLVGSLPFEVNMVELDRLLTPSKLEDAYRSKVTLSQHVMQAAGLLASYGSFARIAS